MYTMMPLILATRMPVGLTNCQCAPAIRALSPMRLAKTVGSLSFQYVTPQGTNLHVEVFSRATAFLESELPSIASCLVLDIRLSGVNGLEFQGVLARAGIHIPIVFMTGHGDIPMSVKAMKAGAIDFLPMISMT
jgi:CheY-like chemotaxis protein